MSEERGIVDVMLVSQPQWEQARRCLPVIQHLTRKSRRTVAEVDAAAAELGYSRAQIYVLINRYQADPRLTSLIPRHRGPARGSSRFGTEIDALVDETIESVYLTRQRPTITDLVMEIRRRCQALGVTAPGRKAIKARVGAKPRKEVVARREGRKAARDRFAPATGSLEAPWPLSLVQIDHTLADVIVVDSVTRLPIQRPWITLAIVRVVS